MSNISFAEFGESLVNQEANLLKKDMARAVENLLTTLDIETGKKAIAPFLSRVQEWEKWEDERGQWCEEDCPLDEKAIGDLKVSEI